MKYIALPLYINLINCCDANNSILERNFHQPRHLTNCLNRIIERFEKTSVIYTINLDLQLNNPVIKIDINAAHTVWFKFERSDLCIIHLNNRHLDVILQKLFENPNISPRGKFVIISDDKVDRTVFIVASNYYLTKLIVLENKSHFLKKIYSYKPYSYENVNKPETDFFHLATCVEGVLDNDQDFFPNNLPTKWRNSTITIINNIIPPYMTCTSCGQDRGIELDVFGIITERLEFAANYTRNSFSMWGEKTNGSYDLLLGDLQKRKGEMVMGAFHSKFREHQDFDMTFNHMEDAVYWLVPKAKVLPHWKMLSLIFSKELYLLLLLSTVMIVIFYRFFYQRSFSSSLTILYQILLECGVHKIPGNKIIIITWIGSCLVLSTIFKSKLMQIMSQHTFEHQINTLSDIVASKLLINIDDFIASFFYHYTNPDEEYVAKNYKPCKDHDSCVNRTAFQQDSVTVNFQRVYECISLKYMDSEGHFLLHMTMTPVFPIHIHLFFVKGHPVFSQVDQLLIRIKSSGFIKHLYDQVAHNTRLALGKRSSLSATVLKLEQMYVAFFLWCIGIFASISVFVFEYFSRIVNVKFN
ncbi:hypothetical protein BDFB_008767 [Asbolus verrucosus]|uniref:Lig chan domain containing protein n=1 Tax=Asbolus verrucosus TaxID=1661398 RepID=A0A482VTH0_ASBVE|nr:hypothetical protein BDFB_008767 [Asbolus verrucosus]